MLATGGGAAKARSFLYLFPLQTMAIFLRNGALFARFEGVVQDERPLRENPWDAAQRFLHADKRSLPHLCLFSYEMGGFADADSVAVPRAARTPLCLLQSSCVLVTYDHDSGEATIAVDEAGLSLLSDEEAAAVSFLCRPSFWRQCEEPHVVADGPLRIAKPLLDRATYRQAIATVKEAIAAGEVYQLNLSHELTLEGARDPFATFAALFARNPAPHAAFWNAGAFCLVSSSPERFLCRNGDRVQSRPIKGTAPRGASLGEDLALRAALQASEKERSELLMITDLMRNDLAGVSLPGSVRVEALWEIEAYSNVFHLVSTVTALVDEALEPLSILRRTFPAGSITGCPKRRAMEWIDRIENRPRGLYTGCMGYMTPEGDFDCSVLIRTLAMWPERIELQLGGGIVYDSDPEREYDETLVKGETLFEVLGVVDGALDLSRRAVSPSR